MYLVLEVREGGMSGSGRSVGEGVDRVVGGGVEMVVIAEGLKRRRRGRISLSTLCKSLSGEGFCI